MASALQEIAKAMVAKGKGILAMDESNSTIEKRFREINAENSEKNRWAYRKLLITAQGLGNHISGAILFDETIRQKDTDGTPFPELLKRQGIITGIKVDKGAKELALFPGEMITEGLDGLRERLLEYRNLGAQFAKWRAVITIGNSSSIGNSAKGNASPSIPTKVCIEANAHALARYAALCQEAGLVPIVEPEVLMDADNTIEVCYQITDAVQKAVFKQLKRFKVKLNGIVLKPNMVVSGKLCPVQAAAGKVAELTVKCLKDNVSPKVPGIAFLSGGQSDEAATENLNEMNKTFKDAPWALTFSYGRALQRAALKAWNGIDANVPEAQKALLEKAKGYGEASLGIFKA